MDKTPLLLAIVFVSIFLVNAQGAYSIDITEPDPGEGIEGGETFRIEWTDSGNITFAAVYYSTDGGNKWSTLYPCNKNSKRFDWDVPEMVTSAEIKVEGWGNCNDNLPLITDLSGEFDIELPGLCTCDSCSSCSNMLEGSCETVYLDQDISGSSSQCVSFESNQKTFDCQGYEISGGATGQEFYYGVFAKGDDITIQNCRISEFEVGIDFHNVDNGIIINNSLTDNYGSGMFIADSDDIDIEDNTVEDSGQGVFIGNTQNVDFDGNRICGSTGGDIFSSPWNAATGSTRNNNVCDLIYNWNNDGDVTWCDDTCAGDASTSVGSLAGLQGALDGEYGTVELTGDISAPNGLEFGSSHVTLDCNGHTILGSGSGIGVSMVNRVNNELRDCTIVDFGTGVSLRGTSHSRILDNIIRDNDYGLVIMEDTLPSRSNTIDGNWIKTNDIYGVYLDGNAFDNTFTGNTLKGLQYSLYTTANCDNNIDTSNYGGAGEKIGYFHDATGLNIDSSWGDRDFSELILCNVRDSEFHGIAVRNTGTDGVLIIDSENVDMIVNSVRTSYQGVSIMNSTDIDFVNTDIIDQAKDCISVSQSSGIDIADGSLENCDRGVLFSFSNGGSVENMDIINPRIAGVQLHDSDSNELNRNNISGNSNSSMGVIIDEVSSGNTLLQNEISGTGRGVDIDSSSNGNVLNQNNVCDNLMDIDNRGLTNSGNDNTCTVHLGWTDTGAGKGCTSCCDNIRNDINNDGVDDACDCYDAYQGRSETGVDCGGICGECVECTWCTSDVEPIRIKGNPNSGMIDVVFVPHTNFRDNLTEFREDVYLYVREHYLRLDEYTFKPIPEDFEDSYNFYIYKDGYGYDGQCAGELPGEEAYDDWIISCSLTCAFTLGLGCGCFADEPDHFYDDAGWADTAGILTMEAAGCANALGPQSHFISERAYPVVIHESAHAIFGLVDEYCGDTYYTQNSPNPNTWSRLSSCVDYSAGGGWVNGSCRRIEWINASNVTVCSKGYFRYDPDAPTASYMIVWGGTWTYKFWEAASERIAYVFDRYPGGGSRGVLIYVEHNATGEMKKRGVTVVEGHPDLGMQVPIFWAEVMSAGEDRIMEFGLWDYRRPAGHGPDHDEFLGVVQDITFPINIPFVGNPRWVNIYNGTSGELVLSIDLGYELYGWCSVHDWEGDDCKSLDIDDNGIPDWQETDNWVPEERVKNGTFGDRPDLEKEVLLPEEPEPIKPFDWPDEPVKPQEPGEGMDLTLVIVILVVIVAALAGVMLFKKKKARPGKPKAEKTKANFCKKCGAPQANPDDTFCNKCGEKL